MMRGFILFLWLSSGSGFLLAQEPAEIQAMRAVIAPTETQPPAYRALAGQNRSDLQWLASQLFLFYKNFISSQDGSQCSFHPSCSEYAIQLVKKRGLIIGGMGACDRLMRCNSMSPELYEFDPRRGLLIDHP